MKSAPLRRTDSGDPFAAVAAAADDSASDVLFHDTLQQLERLDLDQTVAADALPDYIDTVALRGL